MGTIPSIGTSPKVGFIPTSAWEEVGGETVPGGFVFSETEDKLYVTLSRSNSLGVVNMIDRSVTEIPVGVAPYEPI